MRILVVNWQDRRNPDAGGAERHLHETGRRLVERGHEVTLLCSGWRGAPAREDVDGIDVRRTSGRHGFAIAARRHYERHLAHERFDVVVEDLNKLPLRVHRWSGRPTLLLVHHLFGRAAFRAASAPAALLTWAAERRLGRWYRGVPVEAVSESTAADLVRVGIAAAAIRVNANGVDLAPQAATARRERVPTFVFVGRLNRYKRVDLIVDAAARLHRAGHAARFVVAGVGPEEAALRRRAERQGVASHVRFLGRIGDDEKHALLAGAWAHVLPSEKEGWGLTVLEAGAVGTPTVATDVPGLRDSIAHGRTGWLVPRGDAVALADALAFVMRAPAARDAAGREARAFAEAHGWDGTADRLEQHLHDVVAGRAPGRHAGSTLHRRPARAVVPVPRLDAGSQAHGTQEVVLQLRFGGETLRVTATFGDASSEGRTPCVALRGLPVDAQLALQPPATVQQAVLHDVVTWRLWSWPDDPEAWLASALRAALPGAHVARCGAQGAGAGALAPVASGVDHAATR